MASATVSGPVNFPHRCRDPCRGWGCRQRREREPRRLYRTPGWVRWACVGGGRGARKSVGLGTLLAHTILRSLAKRANLFSFSIFALESYRVLIKNTGCLLTTPPYTHTHAIDGDASSSCHAHLHADGNFTMVITSDRIHGGAAYLEPAHRHRHAITPHDSRRRDVAAAVSPALGLVCCLFVIFTFNFISHVTVCAVGWKQVIQTRSVVTCCSWWWRWGTCICS
jgi:hypothetical protein